jgi:hypothetical protein
VVTHPSLLATQGSVLAKPHHHDAHGGGAGFLAGHLQQITFSSNWSPSTRQGVVAETHRRSLPFRLQSRELLGRNSSMEVPNGGLFALSPLALYSTLLSVLTRK